MFLDPSFTNERKVEVYEDGSGQWRWRRKMRRGGRIVADSGESYKRQNKAAEAAQRENPGIDVFYPQA